VTHPAAFTVQQRIGEALLAAGWHAPAIAVASKPGSSWVLQDPTRRVRVLMSADLSASMAEVRASWLAGRPHTAPSWYLSLHHAAVAPSVAAILAAPQAADGIPGQVRRRIAPALREACILRDRGRLVTVLSGSCNWRNPDRSSEVTWTAPTVTKSSTVTCPASVAPLAKMV